MAARAEVLGDTGANHPDHWVGGLASPDLHAIVILFARDVAGTRALRGASTQSFVARVAASRSLSSLDLEAIPPLRLRARALRLSRSPVAAGDRGHRGRADAGLRARRSRPGEFFLGYPDETGLTPALPQPEVLYAQRQLSRLPAVWRSTSARSATSCAQHGEHAGGAGAGRGEADGALAQRRAARARAREGRPGARRGHAAQQRLQLRHDGSARLRAARSARTSGG